MPMNQAVTKQATFQAIFGLLTINLMLYAVIYPMNGAPAEEWVVMHIGYAGTLYDPVTPIRIFGTTHLVLMEFLFPGNAPSRAVLHMLLYAGSAIGLFHMTKRLGHNTAFAFLVGAIFSIYIPENDQMARSLFVYAANFAVFLPIVSGVMLIEAVKARGRIAWVFVIISALLGMMAITTYEVTIPVLGLFPLVLLLIPKVITRRNLVIVLIWGIGLSLAVGRFLYFVAFSFEGSYQESVAGNISINNLSVGLLKFIQASFQFETFLAPSTNYLFPSLLIASVSICAFLLVWRSTERQMPALRPLLIALLFGLLFTALGGMVWATTGFPMGVFPRMHFAAQPGQALVVAALIGIIAVLAQRLLKVSQSVILVTLLTVFFVAAGHWFFQAQLLANNVNADLHRFDEQLILYQEIVSLAPYVEEDTFFILDCPTPHTVPQHFWFGNEKLGAVYLYQSTAHLDIIQNITFDEENIRWEFEHLYPLIMLSYPNDRTYEYEQIILLECYEDKLRIIEHLPADQIPEGLDLSAYHPYGRIIDGFLPPERSRIFRW